MLLCKRFSCRSSSPLCLIVVAVTVDGATDRVIDDAQTKIAESVDRAVPESAVDVAVADENPGDDVTAGAGEFRRFRWQWLSIW